MGKNSIKRRQSRLKFKRRTAALMGAAIMTGAVLSGIPATKALAAETTTDVYPIKAEISHHDSSDSRSPGRDWHQHKYSWPASDENQALYQDGKIYYRSDNNNKNRWWSNVDKSHAYLRNGKLYYQGEYGYNGYNGYNNGYNNSYAYYVNSPVDYVKDNAAQYGFNSYQDSFSLLTASNQRAVVEVRRNDTGKLYNVILERTNDRDWTIVDVRAL
ncbi:hypothetical protein [Sporomusa aerivorans]|uniref:hypothetical protein n=1 Tax=Sporomusa aerivorans TaxID=204936 RepID=UPI00352B698E